MSNNLLVNENVDQSLCIPHNLLDFVIVITFPPLWMFIKELKSPNPMENFYRIIVCFVLTSMLYFPGLMYALSILRTEGTIF